MGYAKFYISCTTKISGFTSESDIFAWGEYQHIDSIWAKLSGIVIPIVWNEWFPGIEKCLWRRHGVLEKWCAEWFVFLH